MLERHCRERRAGRRHSLLAGADQFSYLHRAVDVSARLERGDLLDLCPHSAGPRNDGGRDLHGPPCRRIGSGGRQPGGVPEYVLRDRWMAVYWQI